MQYIGMGRSYMYKGNLYSTTFISPVRSVGIALDFKSQGCGLESHCKQDFFILHFVAFDALQTGRQVPHIYEIKNDVRPSRGIYTVSQEPQCARFRRVNKYTVVFVLIIKRDFY